MKNKDFSIPILSTGCTLILYALRTRYESLLTVKLACVLRRNTSQGHGIAVHSRHLQADVDKIKARRNIDANNKRTTLIVFDVISPETRKFRLITLRATLSIITRTIIKMPNIITQITLN